MLDESLLDDAEALARADHHGLLRGTAGAGARVRTAARQATEAGLTSLRPDGRPRGLLVAGPGPAAGCAADLLAAVNHGAVPVALLRPTGAGAAPHALRWTLPGWAGPVDLLLVVTPDGTEPGLAFLAEQAYRRGCTVVAVTPAGGPLAETVSGTHGLAVPVAPPPAAPADGTPGSPPGRPATVPGTLWALLTPLLVLTDRLGLGETPGTAVQALADRLDRIAERCGPATPTYANPAKTLAVELAEALPVLWSEGPLASAAARHFTTVLAALPGRPALAAELPEALTSHAALLTGAFAGGSGTGSGTAPDDFFRDRVEEAQALRPRLVLLRDSPPPAPGPPQASPQDARPPQTGGDTGETAAPAVRALAHAHGTALSELRPAEGSSALEAAADLVATTDFAAVYLTLTASA
ncbi:SIS domain-containing protein [Streptomyces sp. TRM 70351]|uniref:SIS domain-containing protein n=1 Tax=Streptomyces sp. TRM 70351 TaxID=3116552 RepID=UPI002E7B2453|nr:SIS domain-containing protein [Streptomyces sp. TRM 70351]MEE1929311.1 SIS domain-containing protein [Streptomyces sp. TRM 70351]